MKEADDATYARRNAAVEQERSIKENELRTERAVQEKRHELESADTAHSISLEESRRKLVDLEAANAYGLRPKDRFLRVIWPTMLRLSWPSYTNEAIFLFHSTTLVFFAGFPAVQQRGDALYYANYFADKTFNPFIPYPILATYFILLTLAVTGIFGQANKRLNRHLADRAVPRLSVRLNFFR